MKVPPFILRYPCVFCGIDTSPVSTWAPEPTGLSASNAPMLRLAVISASALSGFRLRLRRCRWGASKRYGNSSTPCVWLRGNRENRYYKEFAQEWVTDRQRRVESRNRGPCQLAGPADVRALAPWRQYARTYLQPCVVATESRGHACDAQSDAGCCGIHDEIAEPCMTPRNPPLGKFDRTTEHH